MSTTPQTFPNLDVILGVNVSVSATLGGCELPMREVLQLAVGSVVHLDKPADAPVDLYINGKLFGRGEVVVVENKFGIKVTELIGAKV